ncbi:hypothetical protein CR513_40449, partial [Mucuna pruriens]
MGPLINSPQIGRPFRIIEVVRKGALQLKQLGGKGVPHTWNSTNMHIYYSTKRVVIAGQEKC